MVTLNAITNKLANCDPVCQTTSKGQGRTAAIMNPFYELDINKKIDSAL